MESCAQGRDLYAVLSQRGVFMNIYNDNGNIKQISGKRGFNW